MPRVFLKDIVDGSDERWGDPRENIGNVVPFGITAVDDSLIGVPIQRGGVFGIQGVPGSRKTTLVLNIVINQCLSGRLPQGYHIAIDTLESGMTIERYADIIIAMVATKYMVYWHWNGCQEYDPVRLFGMGLPSNNIEYLVDGVREKQDDPRTRETVLRPEFFTYCLRTKRQMDAINIAKAVVRNWPIMIFGISEHPDLEEAKRRTTDVTSLHASYERWCQLSEETNVRELIVDHLQEYHFTDRPTDFEVMKRGTTTIARWQKSHRGVAWIISQIGVTSERESRNSKIDAYAQGGKVLEAEAQLMWQVQYDKHDPHYIELLRPIKSRIGMHGRLALPIEPNSGVFIGQAIEYKDLGKL